MHRIAAVILAGSALPAAGQTFTITEQFRAIVVEAYAEDVDGFIGEDDIVESAELFNFNEDLFVEAEFGGAAAVALASQASLLDPDFIQVDCSMFTEAIAEVPANASSYVENVGDMTFTIEQAATVVLAGSMFLNGGESCEMTVYLFDGEGEAITIIGIGGREAIEFSESFNLGAGEYRLVNEQFAEGLRKEEAIEGEASFSLSFGDGCAADCNGDGSLDILDFVCFQQVFQAGDPAADCSGDGELNILDFVCYQALFQAGCG